MIGEVRSLDTLGRDEIIALARQQADAFQKMEHHFERGCTQAVTFERAYQERRRELDFLSAEVL